MKVSSLQDVYRKEHFDGEKTQMIVMLVYTNDIFQNLNNYACLARSTINRNEKLNQSTITYLKSVY